MCDPHWINFYIGNEINIGANFSCSVVPATFVAHVQATFMGLDRGPCDFRLFEQFINISVLLAPLNLIAVWPLENPLNSTCHRFSTSFYVLLGRYTHRWITSLCQHGATCGTTKFVSDFCLTSLLSTSHLLFFLVVLKAKVKTWTPILHRISHKIVSIF